LGVRHAHIRRGQSPECSVHPNLGTPTNAYTVKTQNDQIWYVNTWGDIIRGSVTTHPKGHSLGGLALSNFGVLPVYS